ncbi:MAG: ABC transporter permease [Lachnospiraceae bacterium]
MIQKEKYDWIQSKKNVIRSAGASWHFHHRIYPGCAYPGDPARMALERDGVSEVTAEAVEAKREELGLNDPVPVQYGRWLLGVLRGDLGTSYSDNTSVSGELLRRLPVTLKLTGCSLLLVVVFGITGGIVAAACSGRAADTGI